MVLNNCEVVASANCVSGRPEPEGASELPFYELCFCLLNLCFNGTERNSPVFQIFLSFKSKTDKKSARVV